jgi:hypothetical protein
MDEEMQQGTEGIVFGARYIDRITGFAGVATGQAFYISGCSQVLLAAPSDGKAVASEWFDEQRLMRDREAAVVVIENSLTPGPDKPAPKR